MEWLGFHLSEFVGFYKLFANHSLDLASNSLNANFDTSTSSQKSLKMLTQRPNFNNERQEQRVAAEQPVRQQRELALRL